MMKLMEEDDKKPAAVPKDITLTHNDESSEESSQPKVQSGPTFRSEPGILDSNDSAEEEESNHPSQNSDDSKLVKRPKVGV